MDALEKVAGRPLSLMSVRMFDKADWLTKHFLCNEDVAIDPESFTFRFFDIAT